MFSMAFLQMKGITRIWGDLVASGKYGLAPLKASTTTLCLPTP